LKLGKLTNSHTDCIVLIIQYINIIYTTLCSCATDLLYTQAVCDWLMCARDHASTN